MTVDLEQHPLGILLPVKAAPGSRRNGIVGAHDGQLKVAVSAAPEKGKANKALRDVLARLLGLRRSQLELWQGETSPHKQFLVRDVSRDELAARLEACLAASEPDGKGNSSGER